MSTIWYVPAIPFDASAEGRELVLRLSRPKAQQAVAIIDMIVSVSKLAQTPSRAPCATTTAYAVTLKRRSG